MNKLFIFKLFNLILLLLISVMLLSCQRLETKKGSVYAFSTLIDISITSNNAKDDYKNIEEIFLYYHKLCDNYNTYEGINNIKTINDIRSDVEVSSDLREIINYALIFMKKTGGYFNPFIGSLSNIYKELITSCDLSKIPSDEIINNELEKMNNTKIVVKDDLISLQGAGLIDLGAIGKGFALMKVLDYLKSHNIKTYLINAGSSSILVGEKENGKNYNVGVKEIDGLVIQKKNRAFGTSSIQEQSAIIDGVLYHHIINPFTGKMDYLYDTVVVVGDNPLLMDLYSTAFFMMDEDKIKGLQIEEIEEIYLCKDHKVICEYKYELFSEASNENH